MTNDLKMSIIYKMKKAIKILEFCPVCDSKLVRINDQLFCQNNLCDAKVFKGIMHFIKAMKIRGLGEKTIEKLGLESINSIYTLSKEYLINELGEKLGIKLYDEIEKSKNTTVDKYITGFGIPLVGKTASEKLAQHTDNIWNINQEVCKLAGLGQKATYNLLDWILHNKLEYESLPIKTVEGHKQSEATLKVCITGKLKDFASREKAKAYLKDYGIEVVSSVSSKIDYLVCDVENSSSSSIKKAEKLNKPIVTMNHLLKKINLKEI